MSNKIEYIRTPSLKNFEKVNDDFLKCTISVMCDSQIANGTKFTTESINKALPTLNYSPVIGYFKDSDFNGHGVEYTIDDGEFTETIKTIPFGVVIKDSYRYEDIIKDNGEAEKYLVCDAYLWSRYNDATEKVKENKCNQSMEISVISGSANESYYEISEFNFEALCILGEDVNPAFTLAKIRTSDKFSKEDFTSIHKEMTFALEEYLKGGNKMAKKRKCSKCEKEFEVDKSFKDEDDFVCTSCSDFESKQAFAKSTQAIYLSVKEEINSHTVEITNRWGEKYTCQKYYMIDVITDDNMVICEDNQCYYAYYGIPFTIAGDKATLDFEKAVRYIQGDWRVFEGEEPIETNPTFSKEIEEVVDKLEFTNQELDSTKAKFTDLQTKFTEIETEVVELREFKSEIKDAEFKASIDSIITEFEALREVEGFNEIFEKRYELNEDTLRIKLKVFAFDSNISLGKKANFSKKDKKVITIPVDNVQTNFEDPYGGILDKFIKK